MLLHQAGLSRRSPRRSWPGPLFQRALRAHGIQKDRTGNKAKNVSRLKTSWLLRATTLAREGENLKRAGISGKGKWGGGEDSLLLGGQGEQKRS